MPRTASILNVLTPASAFGAQRGSRRGQPPAGHHPSETDRPSGWRCRFGALAPPRHPHRGGLAGDTSDASRRAPF